MQHAVTAPTKTTLSQTLSRAALNGATCFAAAYLFSENIACLADVEGNSMLPTLQPTNRDVLLVQKFQRHNILRPGDVVVLRSPVDPTAFLVKRVIGLPSQTIPIPTDPDMSSLLRSYANSPHSTLRPHEGQVKALQLPSGHIWVEGDNLDESVDSRHFGAIPQALVQGIAIAKFDLAHTAFSWLTTPPNWTPRTRRIAPAHFSHLTPSLNDETQQKRDAENRQASILQTLRNAHKDQQLNLTAAPLDVESNAMATSELYHMMASGHQGGADPALLPPPQHILFNTPTARNLEHVGFGQTRAHLNPYLDVLPKEGDDVVIHPEVLAAMQYEPTFHTKHNATTLFQKAQEDQYYQHRQEQLQQQDDQPLRTTPGQLTLRNTVTQQVTTSNNTIQPSQQ